MVLNNPLPNLKFACEFEGLVSSKTKFATSRVEFLPTVIDVLSLKSTKALDFFFVTILSLSSSNAPTSAATCLSSLSIYTSPLIAVILPIFANTNIELISNKSRVLIRMALLY